MSNVIVCIERLGTTSYKASQNWRQPRLILYQHHALYLSIDLPGLRRSVLPERIGNMKATLDLCLNSFRVWEVGTVNVVRIQAWK